MTWITVHDRWGGALTLVNMDHVRSVSPETMGARLDYGGSEVDNYLQVEETLEQIREELAK